jgi:hypothetical protein
MSLSILEINEDCLCYIAMHLDAASKYMFTLTHRIFLGLRDHHKKLFANRKPTDVVNAALRFGSIRLLRFLKGLGVKYVGRDTFYFNVRSLGRLKWFVNEIKPLDIKDKRRLTCLITPQSEKDCDEYVCSLIDVKEIALRPRACLFEKWNKPIPSLETYLQEMMETPSLIGRMCAQKTLTEGINRDLVVLKKEFYMDMMLSAFKSHHFKFCDDILKVVHQDNDGEYIKTLSETAIMKCDVRCVIYLKKRKILADHAFLSASIKSCSAMPYMLLGARSIRDIIDFFRGLFHIGVKPPLDIFTDELSSWRRCSHYIFIKFFISRGVHPDTSGKILENFPKKRDELVSMGFK